MAHIALRIAGICMTALVTACATPSFEIDAVYSASGDPILLTPGTKGVSGGPIQVPLPEFLLDSVESLPVGVATGQSTIVLTLKMSSGKLYAHIPQQSFEPLARMPSLAVALHEALKDKVTDPVLKLRNGGGMDATLALAMSLAERLPRRNSNAWVDAYNYDPGLRALALVPGMRLRLEVMLPVTSDIERRDLRSQGSITPPAYLNILPAGDGASAILSPALEGLSVRSEDTCTYDDGCTLWRDASGVHNLLGKEAKWRFWSLFYPANLGEVGHVEGPLQFVHEELMAKPEDGLPAVLLVGTSSAKDMSAFVAAARARRGKLTPGVRTTLLQLRGAWREAVRKREAAATVAKLHLDELARLSKSGAKPRTVAESVAVEALKGEERSLSDLVSASGEVAINCNITSTPVAGCFVLRYRVLPVPEILVTVQGTQRWVEIGTTVGMVLAPHESIRTTASFAGTYGTEGDEWRNLQTRIPLRKIEFSRLHMGVRSNVVAQVGAESPDDAIRRIILQPGDEIKWSN